jgi:RNA polymerase sigma-70 factor, ECF subfamily
MMEKWQTGDIGAFEALFRQYEKLVFKNAYLIIGNKEEAEDVLQQVFTSVWKSRKTYDPVKGKFTTWLHRITVNECMRKQHKKHNQSAAILNYIDPSDMKESEPGEALMKKEQCEKVMNAVNQLDNKHRSILVLRYFNELSYDDISRVAGIPLGTVKSRINNGLKILRGQLETRSDVGAKGEG